MGRIFAIIGLVLVVTSLGSCKRALSVEQQLMAYSQSQAEGDFATASIHALALLDADFSGSPFSEGDLRMMKTDFAITLDADGQTEKSIEILRSVLGDQLLTHRLDAATYASDIDIQDLSAENMLNAERAIYLGSFFDKKQQYAEAYNAYTLGEHYSTSVYGEKFPDSDELLIKRFLSAKQGKLDPQIFCILSRRIGWIKDNDRVKTLLLEGTELNEFGETVPYSRSTVFLDGIQLKNWDPEFSCPAVGYSAPVHTISEPAFESIKVFYGTSQALSGSKNIEKKFNASPAKLSIGSIEMTVPLNREVGSIQIPGMFDWKGAQDGVHIVLKRITPADSTNGFQTELSAWVGQSSAPKKEAFIYVHGHGVKFANAARRTAQLAVDLDMRNGAIFYSWPAGAASTGYFKSQANVASSAVELETYLKLVSETQGIDELHIIAHSMGNDVLSQALKNVELEGFTSTNRPFGQIIWASPDVDAAKFATLVSGFKASNLADGMTLYASSKDKALSISQWIWDKFPRAGQAPPLPSVATIIQTIDTSEIDRNPGDVVAHTDYASAAIDDMRAVIWLSLQPGKRCDLNVSEINAIEYWSAGKQSEDCDKFLFRSAVTLARAEQYRYIDDVVDEKVYNNTPRPEPVSMGTTQFGFSPDMFTLDPDTGKTTVTVTNPYRSGVGRHVMELRSTMDSENWHKAKGMAAEFISSNEGGE